MYPPDFFETVKPMIPLGREGKPEDIANAIVFLASEESSYMAGETMYVSGGMYMKQPDTKKKEQGQTEGVVIGLPLFEPVQYYFSLIITDSYKAEKMNLTQIYCISEGTTSGKPMF